MRTSNTTSMSLKSEQHLGVVGAGQMAGKYRRFVLAAPWLLLPPLALLVLTMVVGHLFEVPFRDFSRDPLAITNGRFYYGYLSQLGCLLWCAAAAVSLFTSAIGRMTGQDNEVTRFFFWGGLLTTLLLLDDMFMLHEIFMYRLHIHEKITISTYGGLLLVYLLRYRTLILKTDFLFLLSALFFLGTSALLDMNEGLSWQYALEDGAKLLGIASWLGYYLVTCSEQLRKTAFPGLERESR
jgi:hypothetical protein